MYLNPTALDFFYRFFSVRHCSRWQCFIHSNADIELQSLLSYHCPAIRSSTDVAFQRIYSII